MRKSSLAIILTTATMITGIACAGNYKAMPLPKPAASKIYNCHWLKNRHVKTLIQQLHHYHINTIVHAYSLRIVIPNSVLFPPLGEEFKASAIHPTKTLADLLHQLPFAKIGVYGYSDNVMAPPLSKLQSFGNAQKLTGVLWTMGIPMKNQTLHYRGLASKNPVANSRYANHAADNRRIEVIVKLPH
jgi:outer membrane protein OmpA-like peptidoglycan-associated protein